MKKLKIFLIPILLMLVSCDKKNEVNLQEIPLGDWDVVEYVNYKEGEKVSFIKGEPYWLLERYAQGITVVNDGYYYRYGPLEEENETRSHEKGSLSLSKDSKYITYTIPTSQGQEPVVIQAEVVSLNSSRMWIKYRNMAGNITEYIFQRK